MSTDRSSDPAPPAVDDETRQAVARLEALAARLDTLADTAELMGDDDGATRFRSDAARCRLGAMARLDGPPTADP